MNLAAWSIRHPLSPIVLFALFLAVGVMGFRQMDITRYPNVDVPVVLVSLANPGASASVMEKDIALPLEKAFSEIRGVRHVYSTVAQGFAAFTAQFTIDTDSGRALSLIRATLARSRPSLPPSIEDVKAELIDVTGPASLIFTVRSPKLPLEALAALVDHEVIPALRTLRTVSSAERSGGTNRQLSVGLNPYPLADAGLSPLDVSERIKALRSEPLPGAPSDDAGLARALGDVELTAPGGRKVPLKSVAEVAAADAPATSFASADGESVIAISVHNRRGVSDVRAAADVTAKLKELEVRNPDVVIAQADSSVPYTLGNYESAMRTLYEGALLTIVVVFLFLRSIRATLIAAIALPLSIIPAFAALHALGFSLNLVSLLGITVVTGILVDDAIVAIENIVRHMHLGKPVRQAALEGSKEISLTIIAISLTIVAVFLPVSLMGGLAGRYFQQFGLTVAVTVIVSLLVALLLTPMLSAHFLKDEHEIRDKETPLLRWYVRLLAWSLKHRFVTVLAGFAIFTLSLLSTQLLPAGFLPAEDTSRALMTVELPEKTTLDQAREAAEAITARLKRRPEVKSVFAMGGGQGAFADVRKVRFVVRLIPRSERQRSQKEISASIIDELDGIEGYDAWSVNETTGQRDLRLAVLGDDGEKVAEAAGRIREQAKDVRLVRHVRTTAPAERPDIDMSLNKEAAEEQGISAADIFETVRIATVGDASNEIPVPGKAGIKIPVRISVVAPEDMRQQAAAAQGAGNMDVNLLGELWITGKDGSPVKLYQVADITLKEGPVSIARRDGKRVVMVEADLANRASLGQALDAIKDLPAAKSLPAGVRLSEVGDAETMRETFESFSIAMSLGIAAVLTILIVLFRSILQPITILASLPLSVGGAILALLLFDKPMDMPVIIGFLMLMGIVTKNAIMLVDFAITHLEEGMDRTEAVLDAGRKRARPIIMTTVAMIAGMTPSALGLGAGGEFRSPMAIAVIGGLIVSTLLSLIFVPALFTVMDDLSLKLRRAFGNVIRFRELP